MKEPVHSNEETPATDFELQLREARQGNPDAIAKLLENYRNYLLLIANKTTDPVVKTKVGASDIVQDTLFTAHQNFEKFGGGTEDELMAWLRQIVKNDVFEACRNFKQTQKRQVDKERPLKFSSSLDLGIEDQGRTPRSDAVAREESQQLNEAMSQLSEEHQQVIRLRNWQDQSFIEIGQQMNRSADAARKLWTRAVLQLQAILDRQSGE